MRFSPIGLDAAGYSIPDDPIIGCTAAPEHQKDQIPTITTLAGVGERGDFLRGGLVLILAGRAGRWRASSAHGPRRLGIFVHDFDILGSGGPEELRG
jgi:hypothetical protein